MGSRCCLVCAGASRRIRVIVMFGLLFPVIWLYIGHLLVLSEGSCRIKNPSFVGILSWFFRDFLVLHILYFLSCVFRLPRCLLLRITRNRILRALLRASIDHGCLRLRTVHYALRVGDLEIVPYDESLFADPLDPGDMRPAADCCICYEAYDRI